MVSDAHIDGRSDACEGPHQWQKISEVSRARWVEEGPVSSSTAPAFATIYKCRKCGAVRSERRR